MSKRERHQQTERDKSFCKRNFLSEKQLSRCLSAVSTAGKREKERKEEREEMVKEAAAAAGTCVVKKTC